MSIQFHPLLLVQLSYSWQYFLKFCFSVGLKTTFFEDLSCETQIFVKVKKTRTDLDQFQDCFKDWGGFHKPIYALRQALTPKKASQKLGARA